MATEKKVKGKVDKTGAPPAQSSDALSVLNAIAAEASRTLDLCDLLHLALDQMMALTGMEGGAVMLVDDEARCMHLAASRNLPRAATDLIEREPVPVGRGIPGISAERCELMIVEDSKDDERELSPFREMGVRTHVCIPLAVRGRALGVLGMIDRRLRSFESGERALFMAVGEQLGIAIERARLFERQARLAERVQILNELMRVAVSSRDFAEVFDSIGEQVNRLISHDRLSIALCPQGEEYYEAYAVSGEGPARGERFPLHESAVGEGMRTGRAALRRSLPEDAVYPGETDLNRDYGIRSMMFVPLESKGRVFGSLNFGSFRPGAFGDKELQVAQEIADHLAVIVAHTMLHDELERTAETLRRLNKELDEANRHKSEFLANLSHELRTPLNAVLGGSELLGDGLFGELNPKQAEYVQDIHESGAHLLSLINDVLDLSKVEAGKLDLNASHFDVRSLMESSAIIVRERAATKSLELQVVPPTEDLIVEADERKVKQIVYNLLSNAVKFTPENGRVVFRARRHGDEVIFVVEDSGPGVPEEFHDRVFDEFYQISGHREGTGLGLAVSRRLVELHGGRIWLESRAGQGSRFSFAIPVVQGGAAGSDGAGPA